MKPYVFYNAASEITICHSHNILLVTQVSSSHGGRGRFREGKTQQGPSWRLALTYCLQILQRTVTITTVMHSKGIVITCSQSWKGTCRAMRLFIGRIRLNLEAEMESDSYQSQGELRVLPQIWNPWLLAKFNSYTLTTFPTWNSLAMVSEARSRACIRILCLLVSAFYIYFSFLQVSFLPTLDLFLSSL